MTQQEAALIMADTFLRLLVLEGGRAILWVSILLGAALLYHRLTGR